MMFRKLLLAPSLAAALALSPVAVAPVAAQEQNDLAKILLGTIAVGIVLNTIENKRERDREASRRANPPASDWPYDRWSDQRRDQRPGRNEAGRLPQACAFEIRTRRGWRDVFGRRCLERSGVRVSRLPRDCAFEIDTEKGRRTVYGARCLDNFGYRTAQRGDDDDDDD